MLFNFLRINKGLAGDAWPRGDKAAKRDLSFITSRLRRRRQALVYEKALVVALLGKDQ